MNRIPHDFEAFSAEEMKYMESVKQRLFIDPLERSYQSLGEGFLYE